MIKVIGILGLTSVALVGALYVQIGKTAETRAALKIFHAELTVQLNENQRVQTLLIEREKEIKAIRVSTQQKRNTVNAVITTKSAEDCINVPLPSDIRMLFK